MYNPIGSRFSSLSESSLNANSTDTVTNSLDISNNKNILLEVSRVSGAHTLHIVTLQCSTNDSKWVDTSIFVTGEGTQQGSIIAQFVRAKVTTAEGSDSMIDIAIQAK